MTMMHCVQCYYIIYYLLVVGQVIVGFLALSIFVGRWATNDRVVVCFVLREGMVT